MTAFEQSGLVGNAGELWRSGEFRPNMEILAGLESVLSRSELKSFISLYLIDLQQRLVGIAECHAQEDFVGVSQQAHTIVSTAGNLGAMKTSTTARRLETACRRGEQELAISLIGDLKSSCEASTAALRGWSDDGAVMLPTATQLKLRTAS